MPLYGTIDIELASSEPFAGPGTRNPFTDLDASLTVDSPAGRTLRVPVFFDGGVTEPRSFKARILADTPGVWSWSLDHPDFPRSQGTFRVEEPIGGLFEAGAVRVCDAQPRFFCVGSRPVYLLAKFLDDVEPHPGGIPFSHTLWSDEHSAQERESFLQRHRALGLNRVNIYVANRGDYDGVSTVPWVRRGVWGTDYARFDVDRWRFFESWVRRLRDEDMVAHIWLFADDSDFGELPLEDRIRLTKYAAARLSGYANVMFCLVLEWEEGWDAEEVDALAAAFEEADPWGRPLSVHGRRGPFDFPEADWTDHMVIQPGNNEDAAAVYRAGLESRDLARKPLLNEEFGWGTRDDRHRQNLWAALLAGAAGSGTGEFLPEFSRFVRRLPFWRFQPTDPGQLEGNGFVSVSQVDGTALFLSLGGPLEWSSSAFFSDGPVHVLWYDPRTGESRRVDGSVEEGLLRLVPPDSLDWVALAAEDPSTLSILQAGETASPPESGADPSGPAPSPADAPDSARPGSR